MQCMVIAKCQVLALQYLRILQALSFFLQVAEFEASPGSKVAEAGAVFEQGLSKQSKVVLRSGRVQHGSTWFNDILLPHHCQSFCHWVSLKHNALEVLMREMVRVKQWNIQIHNLAHRILLSACSQCRALLSQSRQRQWVWTMSCHKS